MNSPTPKSSLTVNYFRNLKYTFKLLGVSLAGNESVTFKMYTAFYFSFTGIFLVLYITEIFKHEMSIILNTLLYQFAAIMGFCCYEPAYAKGIVVLTRREKLRKLLNSLENEPFLPNANRGKGEEKLANQCVWITKIQTRVYWAAIIVSILLGIIMPVTKRIQSDDHRDWDFSYGPFTVLNVTYSPNYEISWLIETFCMHSLAVYFCTIDLLAAAVLAHISLQFKFLQNYIRNVVRLSHEKTKKDGCMAFNKSAFKDEIDNSIIPWRYLKKALTNIVKYHLTILDIANELETMFSSLLLLIFVSTLALLSLLVYRISILSLKDHRLFRAIGELICACSQTFIICIWGEQILQESQLVGSAVFQADFVGTDLRFQKGLLVVMVRNQKPTVITANKYAVICLSTFVWILHKSYSAYMMLHTNSQFSD